MQNDEISIDKNNLDEECVELPADYDEWSSIEERALAMLNALITRRAVVKAKSQLELRGTLLERINKRYNLKLEKVTEQAYKDLVYLHKDVVEVTRERDEIAEMYHIAKAKRQSLDKKKGMLDYLTNLHGQGYFIKASKSYKKKETNRIKEGIKKKIDERKRPTGKRVKA